MLHGPRTLSWLAVVMLCPGAACQVVLGIDDTRPRGVDARVDGPGCDGAACDWWDPGFERRRKLRIEGVNLTADAAGVPVLVVLDPARITYAEAGASGASLRFVAADHATELAHEVESWQADGTSYVWVLVPQVLSGDTGVDLWMYYGNAAAGSGARPGDLWMGAGYESVHHLHEGYQDSSGNGHEGTGAGGGPDSVKGRIAGGQRFDGNDEYIELAGEARFDFRTSLSVEAWINVREFDVAYQPVVTKGDNSWRLHRAGSSDTLAFAVTSSVDQIHSAVDLQGIFPVAEWHHVAAVYDGQEIAIYLDGARSAALSYSTALNDSNEPVRIGHNSQQTDRYFDGHIDELRIAPVPRTDAWIAAAYRAMADPSFITYAASDELYP